MVPRGFSNIPFNTLDLNTLRNFRQNNLHYREIELRLKNNNVIVPRPHGKYDVHFFLSVQSRNSSVLFFFSIPVLSAFFYSFLSLVSGRGKEKARETKIVAMAHFLSLTQFAFVRFAKSFEKLLIGITGAPRFLIANVTAKLQVP